MLKEIHLYKMIPKIGELNTKWQWGLMGIVDARLMGIVDARCFKLGALAPKWMGVVASHMKRFHMMEDVVNSIV